MTGNTITPEMQRIDERVCRLTITCPSVWEQVMAWIAKGATERRYLAAVCLLIGLPFRFADHLADWAEWRAQIDYAESVA